MKKIKQPRSDSSKMLFELIGVVLFITGTYLFLCIASHNPRDNSFLQIDSAREVTRNIVGYYGNRISSLLFAFLGLASYSIPLLILFLSYRLFFLKKIVFWLHKAVCSLLVILTLSSLIQTLIIIFADKDGKILFANEEIKAGGVIGQQLSSFLIRYLGLAGAISAIGIVLAVSLFVVLGGFSFSGILGSFYSFFSAVFAFLGRASLYCWRLISYPFAAAGSLAVKIYRRTAEKSGKDTAENESFINDEDLETQGNIHDFYDPFHLERDGGSRKNQPLDQKSPRSKRKKELEKDLESLKVPKPDINIILPERRRSMSESSYSGDGNFNLPPLSILKEYPVIDREQNRDVYRRQSRNLENKLLEHKISGNVIDVKPGPVVTRYDFRIAPSIRIKSIKSLEEDISLALGVNSIRIIPVPENRSLGFEIPNDSDLREIIGLKDIIKSEEFISKFRIPFALGKDIAGNPVVTDLSHMPHLLIGGATGSGKSVCLNSLLVSLLYRFTPEELQLILIDPKQIEFGLYEDLPHLIAPVITDPDKAVNVLKWGVNKMEECYKDLAAQRVRNIQEYNFEIRNMQNQGIAPEEIPQLMPYRIIIIDEFGDLMMTSKGNDLDECILRLAQKARAVGIHLIMATQRPSVDVITGLIKANLRARIAFRVTQGTDSKTILDRVGAERLLGKGDMFYRPPDIDILKRVHGAYIATDEIKRIVEFIKKQRKPDYDEAILSGDVEGSDIVDEIMSKEEDPLYPSAVELVVRNSMASVSMLQRRLKIGHARASRLIDMMAYDKVVGPFVGSKMRDVFLDENSLKTWLSFGQSREKLRDIASGLQK